MSERNIQLHRRLVQAFNARDVEAMVALSDQKIEFHALPAPRGGTYRGHDGVRRWHLDLEEAWGDEIRAEPEAYFDLGELTLVFSLLRAHGRQSGAEVAMPSASVARWREGLSVYGKVYADRRNALRELGVSEDALKPIAP